MRARRDGPGIAGARRQRRITFAVAAAVALLIAVAIVLRPFQVSATRIAGAQELVALFDDLDYRIAPLRQGTAAVPRVLLQRLPRDFGEMEDAALRKRAFLRALLPLVLHVNQAVLAERAFLAGLAAGGDTDERDRLRLEALARAYRVPDAAALDDRALVDNLLPRVDAIPPSLALAQAAVESGWGTSRFAHEGNALFGQSSWNEDGLAPEGHEVPPFRIAAFASLEDSVRAYVANLNSHPAYRAFRSLRSEQRAQGLSPEGRALAATLLDYAETGEIYARTLEAVMDDNRLGDFDGATLDDGAVLYVSADR